MEQPSAAQLLVFARAHLDEVRAILSAVRLPRAIQYLDLAEGRIEQARLICDRQDSLAEQLDLL